ncbi:serine aminopeptidase domain-containing protein [Belnapia sp. F-4-1]|uniref:serine aminopeptidase domain-containing protein n=1 Tax=Belnapia sp. F-4-1 TaxID=1545443 RepID=UPI00068C9C39|nr:alpha/beta hydrolase [Belnapia sp. F-4-1]
MIPVAFHGCRGWLHPAQGAAHGLVLCPPFGYELICTHAGLRVLAEQVAAAGTPVLRFDYPGTGDSAGEEAPHRLADWLAGIDAACDWMRATLGLKAVSLGGLRLGALLAAASAARRPGSLADMVLLAPVWSGRAHGRELLLGARAAGEATPEPGWLESAGFRLHDTDIADLRGLDLGILLRQARPGRILLAEPPRPATLPDLGVTVTALPFEGQADFLRHAQLSIPPRPFFDNVARWLAKDGAPPPGTAAVTDRLPVAPGIEERVLRFGGEEQLAGILCRPSEPQPTGVLILNTGANHHIGNGRIAVRMARRLAELGFASLRMDSHGIGESGTVSDEERAEALFGDTPTLDALAGLDLLEHQGFRRSLVVGVCSGGHHAFQTALRDARVAGLAIANLPAFDRAAGGAPDLDGGPPPGENPRWRKLRMAVRRSFAEADRLLAERLGLESGLDRAGRWLRQLQARGTTLCLVYSERDRSIRELRAHFGRGGRHLPRRAPVRTLILSGTDHAINPRSMQDELIGAVEEELLQHHAQSRPAATPRQLALTTPIHPS